MIFIIFNLIKSFSLINPIIPGYPEGWIIISLLAGIGEIVILNKSKRIKLRN